MRISVKYLKKNTRNYLKAAYFDLDGSSSKESIYMLCRIHEPPHFILTLFLK